MVTQIHSTWYYESNKVEQYITFYLVSFCLRFFYYFYFQWHEMQNSLDCKVTSSNRVNYIVRTDTALSQEINSWFTSNPVSFDCYNTGWARKCFLDISSTQSAIAEITLILPSFFMAQLNVELVTYDRLDFLF